MKTNLVFLSRVHALALTASGVALAALVACGGGGGGGGTVAPPPTLYSASAVSAPCWDSKTLTGTGTSTISQAEADLKAKADADTKYNKGAGCAAVPTSGVALTVGKDGVTVSVTGLPNGPSIVSGNANLTGAVKGGAYTIGTDGVLTPAAGVSAAYAASYSYAGTEIVFGNAPKMIIAGSLSTPRLFDTVPATSKFAVAAPVPPLNDLGTCTGYIMDPCFVKLLADGTIKISDTGMTLTGLNAEEVAFYSYSVKRAGAISCSVPFYKKDGSSVYRRPNNQSDNVYGNCTTSIADLTQGSAAGVISHYPEVNQCVEKYWDPVLQISKAMPQRVVACPK